MTENIIKTVRIYKIVNECNDVKTLFFNMKEGNTDYIPPKPGQFVMVWIPGVDEVPMSVSGYDENGNWTITVKDIGECTNSIHQLKIGDFIGIRGPLGNYFKIPNDKSKQIFLIGGGIGLAPLKCFAVKLIEKNFTFTIIAGAKTDRDLIFIDDFQSYKNYLSEIHFCTDDGSTGLKALASDIFEQIIKEFNEDEFKNIIVYSCGPEIMLYKLLQICDKHNIELYASLERIMRCGCGLCGLCALDPVGLLVCKDGPVFNSEVLIKIEDFGKYQRDFTGKKITLD
ncbi:MAG: dihydroorotate dehydrogenase electron transfer subunit [Promethearchaeota archaeon]